jgi:hypothetical protein
VEAVAAEVDGAAVDVDAGAAEVDVDPVEVEVDPVEVDGAAGTGDAAGAVVDGRVVAGEEPSSPLQAATDNITATASSVPPRT